MSTLEKAISIAIRAHSGQVDKAGQSYILHPMRVMKGVTSIEEKITAILHDVIEDTTLTYTYLETEGFSPEILDALCALTKLSGETRIKAARRAAANPIARVVKMADVRDNLDLSRIAKPDAEDLRRCAQYREVLEILQNYKP